MSGAFEARGEGRVLSQLEGLDDRFKIGLRAASEMAVQVLVRQTQAGMQGAGGGRVYGGHQASAPGGYSAVESGAMIGSVDGEVDGAEQFRFGIGVFYGVYHELGTSKMEPRPNLTLAVNATSGTIQNLLGQITFNMIVGG